MTEGWFKKLMGDLPSLVTVAGALTALGIWVGNLKNQIDNSQQQVEQLKGQVLQLQDILQKSQTATSSGLRGPAGPKGDTGDIGPQGQRGERGPQGEPGLPGAAADPALIKSLVQAELQKIPLPNIPSTLGSVPSAAMPKQTSFTSQQCAYVDDLRATEVIEIQVGTEICERSGKLLAKLTNISINGYMGGGLSFDIPGRSDGYRCFRMEPCELPWIPGRTFTIERFKGNGSSTVAQLRAD